MDLVSFVRSLPKHWATAPIYAKGAKMPNGKEACGKSPLGRAPHEKLSPEFTAQHIEKHPEEFKAVGVYSGARSEGLVIFDVDANLGAIEEKWGKDLENAPRITSTKKNAAKFLFVVPEEDRLTVSDLSHAAGGHEGWEVRASFFFCSFPILFLWLLLMLFPSLAFWLRPWLLRFCFSVVVSRLRLFWRL